MSSHLLREFAPITDRGWEEIDDEARTRLKPALAARALVDFSGPHGWQHACQNLGRINVLDATPIDGLTAAQRRVLPLTEVRAPFVLSRAELRDGDRGAPDVDYDPLDAAALLIASAENRAVFHGWEAAGIIGISEMTPHAPIALGDQCATYPTHVARAVETLKHAGIDGPYGIALGREAYTRVLETTEHGGYPLLNHLRAIVDGPLAWAPGVDGAVVLSLRGGDFLFESGEDLAVGYDAHTVDTVDLYLVESFAFLVATPEAAVYLSP